MNQLATNLDPDSARQLIGRRLSNFELLPLIAAAAVSNRALPALLSETTGLSRSRVAEGNLDRLRQSTLLKAELHCYDFTVRKMRAKDWPEAEIHKRIAALSALGGHSGDQPKSLSITILALGDEHAPLTLAQHRAGQLDQFIGKMRTAVRDNRPSDFAATVRAETKRLFVGMPNDMLAPICETAWAVAADWVTLEALGRDLFEWLLMDFLSAIDADWGSSFVRSLEPIPILTFLMTNPIGWEPGVDPVPTRNPFVLPVRRLLELGYGLAHRRYSGGWLAKAPGRKKIREASNVDIDQYIGNYFDGTKQLTLDAFEQWWKTVCKDFIRRHSEPREMACPYAIAWSALVLQQWTVLKRAPSGKLVEVLILDQRLYTALWSAHRGRWAAQLPVSGTESWPSWIKDQLSSSAA